MWKRTVPKYSPQHPAFLGSISDYPRPMKGIPVAMTVINGTLTSSGRFAI
jgi:hypothetical protein